TQRLDEWITRRHFAEGLIGFVQRSVVVGRPAHAVALHEGLEPLFTPVRYPISIELVDPEWRIELAHQVGLHPTPMAADGCQQRKVDRYTATFLLRDCPLVLGAKHRMRQRANRRNDVRNQTREPAGVVLAVLRDVLPFLRGEWRTSGDAVTHVFLVRSVDLVFEEIAQRAGQRIES